MPAQANAPSIPQAGRQQARGRVFTFLLTTLAATDLTLFLAGSFALTLFWAFVPIAMIAMPFRRLQRVDHGSAKWLAATVVAMGASVAYAFATAKGSSLVLSGGFLVFGTWMLGQRGRMNRDEVGKTMERILWLYAITAILGTLLITFDGADSALAAIAKSSYDKNSDTYRVQGLASEPSYAAIVAVAAWLSRRRLAVQGALSKPGQRTSTLLLLFCLFMFKSVYGVILLLLMASTYIRKKHLRFRVFALIAAASIGLVLLLGWLFPDSRLQQILNGVFAFDIDLWMEADNSSFMRFGPLYYYFANGDIGTMSFWGGHGAASSTKYFGDAFGMLAGEDVDSLQVGFIPAFLYDYGFFAFVAVIGFGISLCRGPFRFQAAAMLILMLFNANLNTQLFWWVMATMFVSAPMVAPEKTQHISAND